MKERGWLPIKPFKIILKYSVLCTADFVVVRGRCANREFVLGTRNDRPCKGRRFIFGGKQLREERLEKAVARQLRRELGITARMTRRIRFLMNYDFFGVNNIGIRYHSQMHIYLVEIARDAKLHPNKDHSSFKWFRTINRRWPSVVRKALAKADFPMDR